MTSKNLLPTQPLPQVVERNMSAVNRSLRTASKQLRTARIGAAPLASAVARSASFGVARASSTPSSHSNFSTSVARKSGAPAMPSAPREYDPEIKDIADYVANKEIDSELAVSC